MGEKNLIKNNLFYVINVKMVIKRLILKCGIINKNKNYEKILYLYLYKGREVKNYSKLMMFILGGGVYYV